MRDSELTERREEVAIVGMAGRFPGAKNVEEFWRNLRDGVESVRRFTREELRAAGVPEALLADPAYVPAAAVLDDAEWFDAAFFGFNPREAEFMDPQHRIFLECAWEALENAGYDPEEYSGRIGVYGGVARNTYFQNNLASHRDLIELLGPHQTMIGNEKDFPATRVSYKLNLTGPSLNVQTACSTSGVAAHLACQSLLAGECDMALVGGGRVQVPLKAGYLYQKGMIFSPDGHCRAFDADAQGTVAGSGIALIVLKRLSDAIADGDTIYAVVKGSAINNDGAQKVGFTAPSVEGQAAAIAEAQAVAEVEPETVRYLEAHGTGTSLGDPIEIAALTKAFRKGTAKTGFCAIGSVKTNIGHLDAGAGVAGIIKTALALKRRMVPPSLNFTRPNPQIDFASSPFYVASELSEWKSGDAPRRAGVSSFGMGGTNAHLVLEEPPEEEASGESRPVFLLPLSARSEAALETATDNLTAHLSQHPDAKLPDVAYTLQTGRRAFDHRRVLVCQEAADAAAALSARDPKRVLTASIAGRDRPVVFLFPGQGAQQVGMGEELYRTERVFREDLDRSAEALKPLLGLDLRDVLYPLKVDSEAEERLTETAITQPALFAFEHALARLWMDWGVQPEAMLGHSVGEYVAACLAGVFSLEDGLRLIAERARLMQGLPAGAMLAVRLPEEEVSRSLPEGLSMAAVNGPVLTVVSGPFEEVAALETRLAADGVASRRLQTSHAFHSAMVEPVLPAVRKLFAGVRLSPPRIPYVSNVTGTWITSSEAVSPDYWARHLRQAVRFSDGVAELLGDTGRIFLEVGPGQTLATLSRQRSGKSAGRLIISSLPHRAGEGSDSSGMLTAMGRLWLGGLSPDWKAFSRGERRRRVPLPTYPFERKRFWIEPRDIVSERTPLAENAAAPPAAPPGGEPPAPQLLFSEPNRERSDMPQASSTRRDTILGQLQTTLHELSGITPSELDPAATFLEFGFDSLFLTQAAAAFQNRTGVPVTFRQLFEATPSLEALAAYVDAQLPPEAPRSAPAVAAPPVAPSFLGPPPAPGDMSLPSAAGVQQLMAQQLQVMAGLLEMMSRGGVATPQAPVPVSPALPAVQPPVVTPAAASPGPPLKKAETSFGPWKPIPKGSATGFTPRQKKHVDGLIARFTARTRESKRLAQANRAGLADPRTVAGFRLSTKEMVYPVVVERASGSRLWDVDGNEWIDITMGFGVYLFGHSPNFVTAAVAEQLGKSMAIGPQTALAGRVAEMIRDLTGLERVAFCNTGSEAVLAALRVCRTVTGRAKIVLFSGDYHGIFDEVLVKGITVSGQRRSVPVAPGINPAMVGDVLVLDYGDSESLAVIEAHAKELAAVLVEPVQSRRPDLQPGEFIRSLRELTKRIGVPMIMDEMITGFRAHPRGAQGYFGVEADLATYGKVIGGGMPIGIVAGKAAYMDALDGGAWQYEDASVPEVGVTWFAGTFVRHPLTLAAAHAALTHLKEKGPRLQEELNEKTSRMAEELNDFFAKEKAPFHIAHFSSLFLVKAEGDPEVSSLLWHHLREKGIHTHEGRPNFLTTAHSEEDIRTIVRAFKESVAELREGGFLPDEASAAGAQSVGVSPTGSQQELLRASRAGDDASCALNLSYSFDLKGALDREALRSAIQALAARHDSLRIAFGHARDTLSFASSLTVALPFEDLSPLAAEERGERLARVLDEEVTLPFDLTTGPLVRARLMKLDESRHLLILTIHHTVCDAFSSGTVARDLGALYGIARRGTGETLPTAMQFSEYARWKREREGGAEFLAARDYWLGRCAAPLPVLELPADRPRPARRTYGSARLMARIPKAMGAELKAFSAKQGCSLFSLLLSGFSLLLHKLSGQDDVIVGIPASGQSIVGRHDLVGHCVHFHPFRSRMKEGQTVSEYLKSAQRNVLDAYEHRNITYGDLARDLDLSWEGERPPLFSVQFNMDPGPLRSDFDGLETDVSFNARKFFLYELGLNMVESDGELLLRCEFNTGLFDPETVSRWMEDLRSLLEAMTREPDLPVSELTPVRVAARASSAANATAGVRMPLSEPQQEIWLASRMGEEASIAYMDSLSVHLKGPLDLPALRGAIEQLFERHDSLRATFSEDGEWQEFAAAVTAEVPFTDLSALPADERDTRVEEIAARETSTPFDFERGPLLRTEILKLSEAHHVLVITVHHLVCDGWSFGTVLDELGELYSAAREERGPTLPEAMQYRDYIRFLEREEGGPRETEAQQYWFAQFATPVRTLALPADRPRPAVKTYNGAALALALDPSLIKSLRRAGGRSGATLFMTLLAGLKILLQRLTGQEDIVVGISAAGQTLVEGKNLVGHCVNFLAIRGEAASDQTAAECFSATKRAVLDGFEHQNYTLGKLVRNLTLGRDPSRLPLVNVSFNLDKDWTRASFAGLEMTITKNPPRFVKFDLSCNFVETREGMTLHTRYNSDLFDEETARRWMGCLDSLLKAIASDPGQRIQELPLLTEPERRQLLFEWNETETRFTGETNLARLFEAQAARTPDATALIFEKEPLTYRELNTRANRLAHLLKGEGIGLESVVGICVERSPEMVVGLLGILKAGGAFLPLDSFDPKDRLAFLLADAGAEALLTQERLRFVLPEFRGRVIALDAESPAISRESGENPATAADPENLAYAIYTSGSTGKPKGVLVPHRAIANHLLWRQSAFPLDEKDRFLQKASYTFDIAVWEIFAPLIAGACSVLAKHGGQRDSAYLADLMAQEAVTVAHFGPALLDAVVRAESFEECRDLRLVFCGGEPLPAELAERFFERSSAALWSQYGPTETCVDVTVFRCDRGMERRAAPIGRPIANTRVHLLDSRMRPVPIGVAGEIFAGGECLARGYLDRPERTAESFVPDPFHQGARLYRTGDLGRYFPDGAIEFLGRADGQIKLRGFRIELGEVEAVLAGHPAVRMAVAVLREDAPGDQRLAAYFVAGSTPPPAAGELRDFLKEKLPDFMVPSHLVRLDALPLTATGKVDRRALPAPEPVREADHKHTPPRDAFERQIAEIWERYLRVTPVGVDDNFFDLGGHSLLAVRVFSEIEKIVGRKLPLAMILQAPTVGALAAALRQEKPAAAWSSLVPIQPHGSKPPIYCIHAVGGNVLTYYDLAKYLSLDQPVYGLQVRGLDGKQPRHSRVEDMAADYIREIRARQPEGPYHLGGSSGGGMIAFEMARQLRAQGAEVGVVALFDTHGPDYKRLPGQSKLQLRLSYTLQRIDLHFSNLVAASPKGKLAYLKEKSERWKERIRKRRRKAARERLPADLRDARNATHRALATYVPLPYDGNVTLFRASKQPPGFPPDPHMGWGRVALGGVEVYEVPGHHGAIVHEPRIRVLAERLQVCLERARAERANTAPRVSLAAVGAGPGGRSAG